jgi:hypothetical protein
MCRVIANGYVVTYVCRNYLRFGADFDLKIIETTPPITAMMKANLMKNHAVLMTHRSKIQATINAMSTPTM